MGGGGGGLRRLFRFTSLVPGPIKNPGKDL